MTQAIGYLLDVPDLLLAEIKVKLTSKQIKYLIDNCKDRTRTILYEEFNKHFNTNYSKLQLNVAFIAPRVSTAKKKQYKPKVDKYKKQPAKPKVKNVYWVHVRSMWIVQFGMKDKRVVYGRFEEDQLEAAEKLADEIRKELGR